VNEAVYIFGDPWRIDNYKYS